MARWSGVAVSSFGASATKRSVRSLPDRGAIVPTAAGAEREAVRLADGPAYRAGVDRPTGHLAEGPAEIATARERTERTLPPGRWMGGSHCRCDV